MTIEFLYILLIFSYVHGKILTNCRFARSFYETYPNIFHLNANQTSLTVQPLYSLTNQSFSSINQTFTIGIIHRFADTYLVPVPFLFQCENSKRIYAPKDCEFAITDTRSDLTIRTSEATRTPTVPLNFYDSSSTTILSLYGAFFKQSTIALRNCRLLSKENLSISNTFHLRIQFEQTIGSKCEHQCAHDRLYDCSLRTKTCQCRLHTIEQSNQFCIDTELATNCSLTPERCRYLCNIEKQLLNGRIDENCQCPLGSQRIRLNNVYHCQLVSTIIECNQTCPNGFICQHNRCIQITLAKQINQSIFSLPILLISLLVGSLFVIIILIIILFKMRSIKCVKFVYPQQKIIREHSMNSSPATITRLSTVHSSSSPCSTLSSSSKSMKLSSSKKILDNYSKIDLFE